VRSPTKSCTKDSRLAITKLIPNSIWGLTLVHRQMTSSTSHRHLPTICRFTCIFLNGAVPSVFRCFPFFPEFCLSLAYTLLRVSRTNRVFIKKIRTMCEVLFRLPGIMFAPLDQKFLSDPFTTFYFAVFEYLFHLIFQ
jgi:hypothetical protein